MPSRSSSVPPAKQLRRDVSVGREDKSLGFAPYNPHRQPHAQQPRSLPPPLARARCASPDAGTTLNEQLRIALAAAQQSQRLWIPISFRLCAALATAWLLIQILTSYPSLFLMFCYPVLLAAILEPMKNSLWMFMWLLSVKVGKSAHRLLRSLSGRRAQAKQRVADHSEDDAVSTCRGEAASVYSSHGSPLPLCRSRSHRSGAGAGGAEDAGEGPGEDALASGGTFTHEGYSALGKGDVGPAVLFPEAGVAITSIAREQADVQVRELSVDLHLEEFGAATTDAGAASPEEEDNEANGSLDELLLSVATWCAQNVWKKVLLAIAILLCMATAARVLVIIGRIALNAAEQIAQDFPHYQRGAQGRIRELKDWIETLTEEKLGRRIQVPVKILLLTEEQILGYVDTFALSVSSFLVQQVVPQTCITTLFVLFLLWCPVKAEGPRKEILILCSDYVKVKSMLSTVLGFLVGLSLKLCGLELYYAAGLLVTVANFIPNGALLCSTFPCAFAFFDDRKQLRQVVTAMVVQLVLINCFAFIIEPLFFGAAVEMHPIPAILGVTFFGYVWGVPGMLISIPLLGAFRLALVAFASRARDDSEQEVIQTMQAFLEGRWTEASELALPHETDAGYDQHPLSVDTELGCMPEAAAAIAEAPVAPRKKAMTATEIAPFEALPAAPEFVSRLPRQLRVQYTRWKVWCDGALYLGLVYFLFSAWSDRVFGIFAVENGSDKELNEATSNFTRVLGNSSAAWHIHRD